MLSDRVDAEMTFAIKLDRIGSDTFLKSFQIGVLADCVNNYKASCQAKASQAAELCDNVTSNCIDTLKQLLFEQDKIQEQISGRIKSHTDKMAEIDT